MKYGTGTDVMQEDWDTLVLLDACRYDDFKQVNNITGTLEYRISKGVDSSEFIRHNFVGRELHDTVYVTANPHVKMIDDTVFHDIITEPIANWDPKAQCVRPEMVTDAALEAHEMYPNKRIIVHYMQPHDPPLGTTAEQLRKTSEIGGLAVAGEEISGQRIIELVAKGEISEERAHKAYRETLEIVLEDVEQLLSKIEGKIVISADHGEMFGESPYPLLGKLYEHYRNPKTVQLCKVPWLIVDGERREITMQSDEDEGSGQTVTSEEIGEQLEALGYK